MAILLSLAALGLMFAGGLGCVLLVCSKESRTDLFGLCGTGMILGAGLVALPSFWLGFLMQGAWLRAVVGSLCIIAAGAGWIRWKRIRFLPGIPSWPLLALAALAVCGLTWFSLNRSDLGWDGLFVWESKARVAFQYDGAIPLRLYTTGRDFFHVIYPPLVPVLEAWIFAFLGRIDESMIKLIGPYFYLAAILVLLSFANRERKGYWGFLVMLPFVLTPFLAMGEGSASSGYSDFPLAAVYLCAVAQLVEYARTGSAESARLGGLSAMLLPFVKDDGSILFACIAVAVIPLVVRYRKWRDAVWIVVPGLITALGWREFLAWTKVPRELSFAPFTPHVLLTHLDRTKPLLTWTIEELSQAHWSLLWPAVLIAIAVVAARKRISETVLWAGLVILPLILYPCIYYFSNWDPVEAHVKSSLPRLFLQIAPAAAFLVGMVCAELGEGTRDA